MAAYRRIHDMHVCVAVGLVGDGGSPPPGHDHACCHLQADCLESGISSGTLRSYMSMVPLPLLNFVLLSSLEMGHGLCTRGVVSTGHSFMEEGMALW